MKSYTYCSDESVAAIIESLPDRYPMELTRSDMTQLVQALKMAHDDGLDWAGDFLSIIATTVDVEMI